MVTHLPDILGAIVNVDQQIVADVAHLGVMVESLQCIRVPAIVLSVFATPRFGMNALFDGFAWPAEITRCLRLEALSLVSTHYPIIFSVNFIMRFLNAATPSEGTFCAA